MSVLYDDHAADGSINSQEYESFKMYVYNVVIIKISMIEYHH